MNLPDRISQNKAAQVAAALWISMTLFVNPSIEVGSVWHLLSRIDAGVVSGLIAFVAAYAMVRASASCSNISSYGRYLMMLALLLGAAQTIGANFNLYGAFANPGLSASANMIDMLFRFVGWSLAIFFASRLAVSFLERLKRHGMPKGRLAQSKFLDSRYFPLWAFLICVACWMPYLIVLYPGVVTSDTIDQINQGLGFTALQDHHPFVQSVALGQLIGIGRALFGSIYGAVIVATVSQMLAFGIICAICASAFESPLARLIVLAFFALHPIVAWYSVTLWKDVLYSGFILLFALSLYKLCSDCAQKAGRRWLLVLFVAALGTLVMKKSGLFVVVPSAIIASALLRQGRRVKFAGVCASSVAVFLIVQVVAVSFLGVIPGKGHEAYSLPLQQIARTVNHHADDIDSGIAARLDEVLPYDELEGLYNPTLADPVKAKFDDNAFSSDPLSFIGAYIQLGMTYPGDYLSAFLNGTYGYWYPETKYWMVTTSDYMDALGEIEAVSAQIYDENYGTYVKPAVSSAKARVLDLLNSLRSLPVVSCLFSIGIWAWAYLFLFVVALRNGLRSTYPVFSVAAMVWVTCLMSPVYAEMRYAFPLLLMLPLAIWCVLGNLLDSHPEELG